MLEQPTPPPGRATVGAWSVNRYFDILRMPVLAGAGLTLILTLFFTAWGNIIQLVSMIWAGWLVAEHHGGKVEALASGAVIGLAVGLTYSLALFLLQPNLLQFISTVWMTIVSGLIGALVSVTTVLLLSLRNS